MKQSEILVAIGSGGMLLAFMRAPSPMLPEPFRTLVVLALFSVIILVVLKSIFWPEDSPAQSIQLSEAQIVTEFQLRRVRWLKWGLLPMNAGLVYFLVLLPLRIIPFTFGWAHTALLNDILDHICMGFGLHVRVLQVSRLRRKVLAWPFRDSA